MDDVSLIAEKGKNNSSVIVEAVSRKRINLCLQRWLDGHFQNKTMWPNEFFVRSYFGAMEIVTPKLIYCYLDIFGIEFDATSFSVLDDVPKGDIVHQKSTAPKLRSPVKAIRKGNVVSWKTEKRYFSEKDIDHYEIFHDYLMKKNF